MKKFLYLFFVLSVSCFAADQVWNAKMVPNAAVVAATATNSTPGTVLGLIMSQRPVRIWVSASGTPATTNGIFIVKFQTSTSTNSPAVWDTAATSYIKLSMTNMLSSVATNVVSDWFEFSGVKYVRIGQMENTHKGPVSNITVWIASPRD